MSRFNVGDYVRVDDRVHGEIISIDDDYDIAFVEYETCTGKHCLPIACRDLILTDRPKKAERNYGSIGDPEEYDEDYIVDKIASFFENEDNWHALKQCWLVDDHSEEFRKLLRKAIM